MFFDGQRVIIVGGSTGIGEAAARAFAAAGAEVTITGRTKPRLDAAAQRATGFRSPSSTRPTAPP